MQYCCSSINLFRGKLLKKVFPTKKGSRFETRREIRVVRRRGRITWITRFFLKSALVCARQLAPILPARLLPLQLDWEQACEGLKAQHYMQMTAL